MMKTGIMFEILALVLFGSPLPAADDERTAVVITLERDRPPEIETLQSWLVADGEPVTVLAIERGPAEVVVVRDPVAQGHLDLLARGFLERERRMQEGRRAAAEERRVSPLAPSRKARWDPRVLQLDEQAFVEAGRELFRTARTKPSNSELVGARDALRRGCRLGDGARLRFVSPLAAPVSRTVGQMNVFNFTVRFPAREKGFLTFVRVAPSLAFAPRFADAVAVFGRELQGSGQRRAVVVMIAGSSRDKSLYDIASVRQHLEQTQVPVFVWSFGGANAFAAAWSGERRIGGVAGMVDQNQDLEVFEAACEELRSTLEAQRVVWLAGLHLPWEIELTDQAEGVRLAGEVPEMEPEMEEDEGGEDATSSRGGSR